VFYTDNNTYPFLKNIHGTYLNQGGLQIAGLFISIGISIVFAILAGIMIKLETKVKKEGYYLDRVFFEGTEEEN